MRETEERSEGKRRAAAVRSVKVTVFFLSSLSKFFAGKFELVGSGFREKNRLQNRKSW